MSSHWYKKDGTTAYGASLKEAREMGYLPSVTTVDKVIANKGLEQWKIRQAVMSALTLDRIKCVATIEYPDGTKWQVEEPDDDYINRILDDSRQQARKAAKLGSVIHHLAERTIKGKPLFFKGLRSDVWTLFKPLQKWIDDNILTGYSEKVLVNIEEGYAGKADFIGDLKDSNSVILDFKTRFIIPEDIKKNGEIKKAKLYDSDARQLSALHNAEPYGDCISVIISSNVDFAGVWIYNWPYAKIQKEYEVFKSALNIYRITKGL